MCSFYGLSYEAAEKHPLQFSLKMGMQFSLRMSNKSHSTETTIAQELILPRVCAESRAGAPLQRKILMLFQHKYSCRKHSSPEK